jgi:hypothetical protein
MIGYQDKINQILRGAETIKNMTNRPNLTEEEKEHYNKVAMNVIYNKTPRTDEADKFVTKDHKLDGKAYDTEWVYASFAQDLEIELEEVKLKRDALWVKTQEDEREINDLRDAVDEKQRQRDEAIRLATLFQALYLRYGKAEDESYSTLLVKKGFESLANLKGLRYFGEKEA